MWGYTKSAKLSLGGIGGGMNEYEETFNLIKGISLTRLLIIYMNSVIVWRFSIVSTVFFIVMFASFTILLNELGLRNHITTNIRMLIRG